MSREESLIALVQEQLNFLQSKRIISKDYEFQYRHLKKRLHEITGANKDGGFDLFHGENRIDQSM